MDIGLLNSLNQIDVAPASEEMALKVLHGIKAAYEKFHNVSYTEEAIAQAVLWASKYITKGSLPGTAVDLIDEAGAMAQLQQPAPLRRLLRFRSDWIS